MEALKTFQESMVTSGIEGYTRDIDSSNFENFEARRVRYAIFWAMYENTAYRAIHDWAATYKTQYGLYTAIRSIYDPAYRLGEFWKTYLWGGQLDPEAGPEGALPIITTNEALRPAIANIWTWSNWDVNKDIVTLSGSVLGDTFLRIVDEPAKKKVYIEIIDPNTIYDLNTDAFGFIKAYTIRESREHPEKAGIAVAYTETAERGSGADVIYHTYLDDKPYAWNGVASAWALPYGFIPMVHIKHNDVGLDWGWSEFHPARSKIHELDDLASMLSDQIRKSVNVKWMFAGVQRSDIPPEPTATAATAGHPQPIREESPAFFTTNPDAKAQALIADLDIAGALAHIQAILEDMERDYPELQFQRLRSTGQLSGTALRIARQPATSKVLQRRANYDGPLVRAHQMAIAIGGYRKYFSGFDLDSYASGKLDHYIGERPVFAQDSIELLETEKVFWEVAKVAAEAGMPLAAYLERQGWSAEDIVKATRSLEEQ